MKIVITTLETPSFKFEAVGATEAQALELLETAWSQHFDDMGRPEHMLSFEGLLEAIEVPGARYFLTARELNVGVVYRDGRPFTLGNPEVTS